LRIYFALGGVFFLQLQGLADENSIAWLAVLPGGQNLCHKTSWILVKNQYWYKYHLVYLIFPYHFGYSGSKLMFLATLAKELCSPARPFIMFLKFKF
jgi:hypothetical protein